MSDVETKGGSAFPEATEDDDGRWYDEEQVQGPRGSTYTRTIDVTTLLTPGKRTSRDVNILVSEAQRLDDGEEVANPAFPYNEEVEEIARDRIASQGWEPAWEQDGVPSQYP